ncbi:MAG: hypothetical protein KKI09_01395 [Spirochaetes bacterium]|nr:hypothetical protein [Spirochaetota bacterium]
MSSKKHGSAEKFRYAFDNFMSRGGFSVFMALLLLFAAAFVLMTAVRFVVNLVAPEADFALFDQMWRVFLQISDAGAVAEDGDMNLLHKAVGIVTIFLGLVLFSSLVAFITAQFEEKLNQLRKGHSRVIEQGHTLILGFGDRALEIIRELIVANESEKRAAVVVLAEPEKDEMDDFFRDRVEDWKSTRIITRSGLSSSLQMLRKVSLSQARSVVVLNSAAPDASPEEKALADARVLKTIMAVMSCTGEADMPRLIAELHLANTQKLARNISPQISIIEEHSVLARLMVQTSRTSGLAQVYDQLVGFEGDEFYFYRPAEGWSGRSYKQLQYHFPTCTLLGYRSSDGSVKVNPPAATVFDESWEALLLAEDDSTIRWNRDPVPVQPVQAAQQKAAAKVIERQLIIGWNDKCALIVEEYANYLVNGSLINVVVPSINPAMQAEFADIRARHSTLIMNLLEADIHETGQLQSLKPEQYDNVIILKADGGEAELRDSQTIATLLEFRHYFRALGSAGQKTQLITEVADSDNIDVIQAVGVNDFLISNKFVSKIYAQVSEEPAVLRVYEDLFNADGSEMYLKPATYYWQTSPGSLNFADICAAATERGETCFGVRLQAESNDPESNYGIYLNPAKERVFRLSLADQLIVLAEDET